MIRKCQNPSISFIYSVNVTSLNPPRFRSVRDTIRPLYLLVTSVQVPAGLTIQFRNFTDSLNSPETPKVSGTPQYCSQYSPSWFWTCDFSSRGGLIPYTVTRLVSIANSPYKVNPSWFNEGIEPRPPWAISLKHPLSPITLVCLKVFMLSSPDCRFESLSCLVQTVGSDLSLQCLVCGVSFLQLNDIVLDI